MLSMSSLPKLWSIELELKTFISRYIVKPLVILAVLGSYLVIILLSLI